MHVTDKIMNVIARVETAISVGASEEDIVQLLEKAGITGYHAFLAFKAAEVSLRMRARDEKL